MYRNKASRLAEENAELGQKLAALKDEDLEKTQEELRCERKKKAQMHLVQSCNLVYPSG